MSDQKNVSREFHDLTAKLFTEKAEYLVKQMGELQGECQEITLANIIDSIKHLLDQWVVELQRTASPEVIDPEVMFRINITDPAYFYNGREFFVSCNTSSTVPLVVKVKKFNLPLESILIFLDVLREAPATKSRLIIPKDYFFFKCTAQWASSGQHQPPVKIQHIFKDSNFETAWERMTINLSQRSENYFWDIFVTFNGKVYTSNGGESNPLSDSDLHGAVFEVTDI